MEGRGRLTEKYPRCYQSPPQRSYLSSATTQSKLRLSIGKSVMRDIPLKQLGNPQKSPILSSACASCSSACINASWNITFISLVTPAMTEGVRFTLSQAIGLVVNIACCSYLQYHQPSHSRNGAYICFHHFSTCPSFSPLLQ